MLDALGRGLAGVTLFGQNISAPDQVSALTAMLRSAAPGDDPVIAIDEEGGDVTRVAYADGSPYPGNAALGAVDDTVLTRAVYRAIGADLAALGINFDLAPCADVLGRADSPAEISTIAKPAQIHRYDTMIDGVISDGPSQVTPWNGSAKLAWGRRIVYPPPVSCGKRKVPSGSVVVDATT